MQHHDDQAFMDELAAAAQLKPARAAGLFLWTIVALFAWLFLWSAFAEVDERVHGQGQVIPSGDLQVLQSLEGGILTDILVHEGDRVKKGDVMIRIDDVQFSSQKGGIEAQISALRAKQARLKAESTGAAFVLDPAIATKFPDIAANEERLYTSRQGELRTAVDIIEDEVREASANLSEVKASISKYARSKELLQKQLDITRRLVEKKAQPEIEQLKLERELNETAGNLSTAVQSQQSLEAKLSAARRRENEKRGAYQSDILSELNEVEAQLASISENLKGAEDRVRRTELKAPVDGIVHKLYLKTVGGVVQPAQKLAEIVPVEGDLVIRARINPSDIAFLKVGQPVRINVSAYDPQIYGILPGTLERIGADTVDDGEGHVYFEADVRATRSYLGETDHALPIAPGMVTDSEIIVGKRTVLTYLMKPILRARDRALTEK